MADAPWTFYLPARKKKKEVEEVKEVEEKIEASRAPILRVRFLNFLYIL